MMFFFLIFVYKFMLTFYLRAQNTFKKNVQTLFCNFPDFFFYLFACKTLMRCYELNLNSVRPSSRARNTKNLLVFIKAQVHLYKIFKFIDISLILQNHVCV